MTRRRRTSGAWHRAHGSDPVVWLAFLVAHMTPVLTGAFIPRDNGFGDVRLYQQWVEQGLNGGGWPVLDDSWVYPVGAILPMLALAPLKGVTAYLMGWVLLTLLLNLVVLIMIEEHERPSRTASWWWVLSIGLLGPVAISRLESVMVPLTVIAVLVLPRRPVIASALLTLAGWIKVVPMVWLVPLALSDPKKSWRMIFSSSAVSAAMIVPALALGSGSRIFSFLTAQADRGLQIESVPASALQAARLWGGGPRPLFDSEIVTWQFDGGAAELLGRAATVLAVPGVLAVFVLTRRALVRAGDRRTEVLAASLLSATLVLIVFNKVGSPQYMAWLSAAVILGLLTRGAGDAVWRRWAVAVLVMDAMTQLIYPLLYQHLIDGNPVVVLVLVGRNVLLVGLLVAVVGWLTRVRTSDIAVAGAAGPGVAT